MLSDCLSEIHKRLLLLRSIEHLITSEDFTLVFEASDATAQSQAETYIRFNEIDNLRSWYRKQRFIRIETLSVRELRKLAQALRVRNYNFLPKSLLLSEIARKQDHEKGRVAENHFSASQRNAEVNA